MNNQSENINELITALSKAQGELKPAIKDSKNPHFNSMYADLNSVWSACREPLSRNNLSVVQTVETIGENMSLVTMLAHASGQWIKSSLPIILPKSDTEIDRYGKERKINKLHVLGSALTYLRRYSLASIVGIATDEDDDGNSYAQKGEPEKPKIKTADKSQWTELNRLIDQCDSDYQKNIWDYLESQNIGSFENMPESVFHKLKKGCISNMESRAKNA